MPLPAVSAALACAGAAAISPSASWTFGDAAGCFTGVAVEPTAACGAGMAEAGNNSAAADPLARETAPLGTILKEKSGPLSDMRTTSPDRTRVQPARGRWLTKDSLARRVDVPAVVPKTELGRRPFAGAV